MILFSKQRAYLWSLSIFTRTEITHSLRNNSSYDFPCQAFAQLFDTFVILFFANNSFILFFLTKKLFIKQSNRNELFITIHYNYSAILKKSVKLDSKLKGCHRCLCYAWIWILEIRRKCLTQTTRQETQALILRIVALKYWNKKEEMKDYVIGGEMAESKIECVFTADDAVRLLLPSQEVHFVPDEAGRRSLYPAGGTWLRSSSGCSLSDAGMAAPSERGRPVAGGFRFTINCDWQGSIRRALPKTEEFARAGKFWFIVLWIVNFSKPIH